MRTATRGELIEIECKISRLESIRNELEENNFRPFDVERLGRLIIRGERVVAKGKERMSVDNRTAFEQGRRRFDVVHLDACRQHVRLGYRNDYCSRNDAPPVAPAEPVVNIALQVQVQGSQVPVAVRMGDSKQNGNAAAHGLPDIMKN